MRCWLKEVQQVELVHLVTRSSIHPFTRPPSAALQHVKCLWIVSWPEEIWSVFWNFSRLVEFLISFSIHHPSTCPRLSCEGEVVTPNSEGRDLVFIAVWFSLRETRENSVSVRPVFISSDNVFCFYLFQFFFVTKSSESVWVWSSILLSAELFKIFSQWSSWSVVTVCDVSDMIFRWFCFVWEFCYHAKPGYWNIFNWLYYSNSDQRVN